MLDGPHRTGLFAGSSMDCHSIGWQPQYDRPVSDMPLLSEYSLAFALFKTYAIPSISSLLLTTRQLSSQALVSRRYADTEILISTWVFCPLAGKLIGAKPDAPADDPRASLALARTNWLHSKYKISNDDYLYTLGLFMFEPAKWAEKFGWRKHSELERYASFVYWSEIGRKLKITDIPSTPESFEAWITDYEHKYAIPAESNLSVANHTMNELLFVVPHAFGLRAFAEGIARAMLDDKTRRAMLQPPAPTYAAPLIRTLLGSAAFIQKHLLLPRSRPGGSVKAELPPISGDVAPRMFPTRWTSKPWYKPASGLGAWDRVLVWLNWHDDVPREEWRSGGYRLHEMGPLRWEGEGHEEVMRNAAELQGCPIAKEWTASARGRLMERRFIRNVSIYRTGKFLRSTACTLARIRPCARP
ncbi:hypothetical protein MKEN_00398300 [Mycena kentingensis (nom. inval.)]|nr:hypothetical protein MKEN_00398300 [Mycena kentingensis (nom. inval.)]